VTYATLQQQGPPPRARARPGRTRLLYHDSSTVGRRERGDVRSQMLTAAHRNLEFEPASVPNLSNLKSVIVTITTRGPT